jgi:hypothetical protein
MMDPADFFSSAWCVDDHGQLPYAQFIAEPTASGMRHHPVHTVADASSIAYRISTEGIDAYFACAGFKSEASRKGDNAAGACCFWLDIDCGPDKAVKKRGYSTQKDALVALRKFCEDNRLPKPTILSSGNGLHCYWCLDTFIPAEEWRKLAKKLKKLIYRCGLLADPARTADIASVLRVPGTMNWKDPNNPKPVQIWRFTKAHNLQAFAGALNGEGSTHGNGSQESGQKATKFPASSAQKIIERCPTLAYVAQTQGNVSEPLWNAMLGLIKHTTEGEQQCHDWSKGDPRYDPDQTQDKIDRWTAGPALCESIRTLPDARCKGCRQTCKSPIQLGYVENLGEIEEALEALSIDYFVAKVGGSVFVFNEREKPLLANGMSFEAFRQYYGDQWLDGKSIPAVWLKSRRRRTFTSLTFDPSNRHADGSYNTWQGLAVTAVRGDCKLIRKHILNVWCGSDRRQYRYVLKWMALLVQKPWIKPEVALVLRSKEGVGKTIIVQMLLDYFGVHGFTTAQKSQVAGHFNGHLFDKVLVVLQEAFFAGDPAAVADLKALVTDATLGYEPKFRATFSAPNYAHVIILTNHEWAVPASEDSRRWMVLDISDVLKGDASYFRPLAEQIASGGSAAFLDHLRRINLAGFNPRALPKSNALQAQRRETLMRTDAVSAWWLNALSEGCFSIDERSIDWDEEIAAGELQESYMKFTARTRSAPPWAVAAQRLRKLVPSGTLQKHRKAHQSDRHHSYTLPDLDDARVHFGKLTGIDPCAT